jgi:hypothetical protein
MPPAAPTGAKAPQERKTADARRAITTVFVPNRQHPTLRVSPNIVNDTATPIVPRSVGGAIHPTQTRPSPATAIQT